MTELSDYKRMVEEPHLRKLEEIIQAQNAEIASLRAVLTECVVDLDCEIEGRYRGIKDHPAIVPKYRRDMETVERGRALLEGRTLPADKGAALVAEQEAK